MNTLLVVPEDFISGKPWPLGLLPRRELQALLQQEFVFKSGNHVTISGLCKEITRATGKRVEWVPDDENLLSSINEWNYGDVVLPPPSPGKPSHLFGAPCSVPLGSVLEHLVWLCTDAENAEQNTNVLGGSIWTVWVAKDVILLVRLPRKRFSSPAEVESEMQSDLSVDIVETSSRGDRSPGLRSATIVLPSNVLAGDIPPSEASDPNDVAPWLPAAPPPEKQKCKLAEVVNLRPGSYDTKGLANEIGRASGMAVHWMPEWDNSYELALVEAKDKDRFRIHQPEAMHDRHGSGLAPEVSLEDALNYLLAWLTEGGPGYDPPDHEVWTAWIADNAIFLISLPDAL